MRSALENDGWFQFNPLVLLKPGEKMPPFFIAGGLVGSVVELSEVAGRIRTSHPVYGIQAKGLDGSRPPDKNVEDMAQTYLEAITSLQPRGPYALAGYSFGGLPMLEVAHRLLKRGELISLLVFIDTYPHPRHWPLRSWMGVLARRTRHHASTLMAMPLAEAIPRALHLCSGFLIHLLRRIGVSPGRLRSANNNMPLALQQVREAAIIAWARYHPNFYAGKLIFFKAEITATTGLPNDVVKIWGKLAQEIEVHTVPGEHLAMHTTHADILAAKLSASLEKAFCS